MRPLRWSQGCSIGCNYCLTDSRHPWNNGTIRTKPITGNPPHSDKAGFRVSYCDKPSTKSVLPKAYWTMNIHAEDGSDTWNGVDTRNFVWFGFGRTWNASLKFNF